MQTNIYDINDGDFANWLEAHSEQTLFGVAMRYCHRTWVHWYITNQSKKLSSLLWSK